MIIEKVDPARECFSDYSLDGNTLTIGGIAIDLAAEEGDQQVIIPIGSCFGKAHRDLMPCCVYIAEVIIPPRKYETVVDPEGKSQKGQDGEPETKSVPVPIDLEAVILRLWPAVDEAINETENNNIGIEGEENGAQ